MRTLFYPVKTIIILLFNELLCGPFKNGDENVGPVIQLCWTPLINYR